MGAPTENESSAPVAAAKCTLRKSDRLANRQLEESLNKTTGAPTNLNSKNAEAIKRPSAKKRSKKRRANDSDEANATYCHDMCRHERSRGSSAMFRCCICMVWMHADCNGFTKKDLKGFLACTNCKLLPQMVSRLQTQVDTVMLVLQDAFEVLRQLHLQKSEAIVQSTTPDEASAQHLITSTPLSKLEVSPPQPIQLSSVTLPYDYPTPQDIQVSSVTIPEDKHSSSAIVETDEPHPAQPEVLQASSQGGNTVYPSSPDTETTHTPKVIIIGDSITKHVDCKRISSEVKANVSKQSRVYTVDHALEIADSLSADIVIVHIGTNHVKNERAGETITKFRLLEEALNKNNAIDQVIISNIVVRNYISAAVRKRIHLVNTALEVAAERNNWTTLLNSNFNMYDLDKDGSHLNRQGARRLTSNFIQTCQLVLSFVRNSSVYKKITNHPSHFHSVEQNHAA